MTTLKTFILLVLILTIKTNYSQITDQSADNFPIDISLKACLDSTANQTTVGMMDCAGHARDSWDSEMNKHYKLLMTRLTKDEKIKMEAAQKKWLEYRDAEFLNAGTIYYDMQGTMWRVVAVNRQLEIVRQRALDLKSYYDNLTFDK